VVSGAFATGYPPCAGGHGSPAYDGLEDEGFCKVGHRADQEGGLSTLKRSDRWPRRKPDLARLKELMKLHRFWLQFFLFALILSVFGYRL